MQKKMQWAQQQRAEHVMNKLNNDDSRIQAYKEVQQQQRMAIAAIQKKVFDDNHTPYPA
jgi:pSer/pThr/pTyr-binding forkhead associated (FHA) protein